MNSATTLSGRALYTVPEAMEMLNLSRTVIYEQIRSGRLLTVTQGRRRPVPASSMTAYIDLLVTEAMARRMPARRSRGEGALYWDESRQRWMAAVDAGFSPTGKRQRRWVTGKTKTEAKQKLLALRRDQSDGLPTEHRTYTVREAVESWLEHGLTGRDEHTVTNRTILARTHVIPALGNRRLVDLTSEEIDSWLAAKSETLSTDTLHRRLSILRRSIRRAQAMELVRRNVALLCEAPRGTKGRPSKSLTLQQATNLLAAAEGTSMNAYIVLALLIGARTEELRALTWDRLDLDGDPPTIQVWRSVRRDGRMKTAKSRRTLELPDRCVDALRDHKAEQMRMRQEADDSWNELGLVFCTRHGSALDAANVRRSFRLIASAAGLNPKEWTPRELRHSFVSLLSSSGVTIEEIAHLVGHGSTSVTERVYRKELRQSLRVGRAQSTSSSMATPSVRPTVWPTGQPIQAPNAASGPQKGR